MNMDLLFNIGLKKRRLLFEVARQGITASVLEVAKPGKDRYYAIVLSRGRDKDEFAELKWHEFQSVAWLIQGCVDYFNNYQFGEMAALPPGTSTARAVEGP